MKIYIRATDLDDEQFLDQAFTSDYWKRADKARTTDDVDLLEIYAYDPIDYVRQAVAQNPHTPADILDELADDRYGRCYVSQNPNASPETLVKIAKVGDWVSAYAVKNKNFPKISTDDLDSYSDNRGIMRELVMDRKTPKDVLQQIQSGKYTGAYRALAQSRRTPPEMLAQLASVDDDAVQYKLVRNPKLPEAAMLQLAYNGCVDAKVYLLKHKNLPKQVYETLSKDPSTKVRCAVAENADLYPDILSTLAGDRRHEVRWAACRNPHTPIEALRNCVNDRSSSVRRMVAYRRNLPEDMIKSLVASGHIGAVLYSNQLPLDMLEEYADDSRGWVRELIAKQDNASEQLLRRLADDPDNFVRRVAKYQLRQRGLI